MEYDSLVYDLSCAVINTITPIMDQRLLLPKPKQILHFLNQPQTRTPPLLPLLLFLLGMRLVAINIPLSAALHY